VRLGLLVLAATAAFPGVWALVSPHSFFNDFPGLGLHWVSSLPPFNEHLIRDVGSFYVAFAVLLAAAASSGDRRLSRVALLSWLVFSVSHLIWHGQHVVGEGTADRWGPTITLGAGVLLTLFLLVRLRRR
jgi:hypothetical protein